jgi:hypothetical protein
MDRTDGRDGGLRRPLAKLRKAIVSDSKALDD